MTSVKDRLYGQFGDPTGALGALAGLVMANRGSNRQRNAWTVEQLDIQPDDHVLEIGYGPGLAIGHATARAHHGRVVGIDHSAVMRRQAHRRNRQAIAAGRVELLRGTPADLAGLRPFHKAFAVNVFMFWPDPVAVLRQISRVLAPGARIALTVQPRGSNVTSHHTRQAGARMTDALHEAGFADVEVRTLTLEPVDAACALGSWPIH